VQSHVLLFEPAATRNTGNVVDAALTAPNGVRIEPDRHYG
jgi:tRNA(Leu) C34 or U34 (ribose-2'-O)-methylase TrmL